MNAIEVTNLTFSYSDGRIVLRDVCFALRQGETLVVAGLSGSGKSTLCHILSGVIPHSVGGNLSGLVTIMDIDPAKSGLPQAALRAGLVFQDPDSQIICSTVEDELAFGLENLCIPPEEIRAGVDVLLAEFGLTSLRAANPAHLSGGQKKLLTIAAVLAPSPPVLILDEPMSGLDEEGRDLVRAAVLGQRTSGRTVVIVDHDPVPYDFADKWLILDTGAPAAYGTPGEMAEQNELMKRLGGWSLL